MSNFYAWAKMAERMDPSKRERQYATWRRKQTMSEGWIAAIEKSFPPGQKVEEKPKGIGLGDVVSKVTQALGIKECKGCAKRKALLNKIRFGS